MNNHIITTKNGQGKQLKCLNCNGRSRLKLKGGLMTFATELASFERIHADCLPKVDGRAKQGKPEQVIISKAILCEVCAKIISKSDGKIPLWRADSLKPFYCHVGCEGGVTGYQVGHRNLIVQSEGEWLYFWRGACGSARNKHEAGEALFELIKESGL